MRRKNNPNVMHVNTGKLTTVFPPSSSLFKHGEKLVSLKLPNTFNVQKLLFRMR